jgi:bromodomain-containing factor 1
MGTELEKSFNNLYSKLPTQIGSKKTKRKSEVLSPAERGRSAKKLVMGGSMKPEDQKMCEDILNELLKSKYQGISWPFLEPVNLEQVPGYIEVVKNPTDLSTIKKRLNDKLYESVEEFHKELKLMVNNCFKFNNDVKKIYDCGIEMERLFETLFSKGKMNKHEVVYKINELKKKRSGIDKEISVLEEGLSEGDLKRVQEKKVYTLAEKVELANKILKLNEEQTTEIAHIISREVKDIEIVGKNEIEVDLKTLPDSVLGEIDTYLKNINSAVHIRVESDSSTT